MIIQDLTTKLKSFMNSQFDKGYIKSADETYLPYPQACHSIIFVRKCYVDVFNLILGEIVNVSMFFAISGTSGIGKSLFFVYILYRLKEDVFIQNLVLKPTKIVFQQANAYYCCDMEKYHQLIHNISYQVV
jgi:hypothetical protein